MTRLAETLGLTDVQIDILATVRRFVDKEVIPNAQDLEHADTYPQEIVDRMRHMGLFGLMIPAKLRRVGGVAADLCAMCGGTRPRLDEHLRSP